MLSKLKCRGFRATSLSTYDFSTLYTTLPHNLIKEKLLDLIEWTFKRALKTMVHFIWHVMTEIKIKLRSFKSSEHINEKGDGPYHGFGYLSLFSDPIDLATWSQRL